MPIKADAYGHGSLSVAKTALASGVDYLAITTVFEGKELRDGGIKCPIIILNIVLPEEIDSLIAADLEPLAGDGDYIDALERGAVKAGKKLPIHLKIDTGMGRIGCAPEEASKLAVRIAKSSNLFLAGTATHLAVSDSFKEEDRAYTEKQLDSFNFALESIRKAGINPGIVHAANSGGVTFHAQSWFDMVRPGILLYGYSPTDKEGKAALAVKPLMELKSAVVFIKEVKKGQSISYGRTWTATEDTLIGTIPLGYGDGISRLLSNRWQIALGSASGSNDKNKDSKDNKEWPLRPLVGIICMDQCMVDLGKDSMAQRWDPVTIFGGNAPHAGIMAAAINTIPYEITCNITKRVPRVYIGKE